MAGFTRRELLKITGMTAGSLALIETGWSPARGEDKFTIASTGGSWGEGIRESFVNAPKFGDAAKVAIDYSHQLESVATAKIIAQCGNPPFTVSGHGEAEAILMADGGCVQPYDLSIVTNYKNIYDTAKLPPRAGMQAWWASFMMLVFGLAYNTKEAAKANVVPGFVQREVQEPDRGAGLWLVRHVLVARLQQDSGRQRGQYLAGY